MTNNSSNNASTVQAKNQARDAAIKHIQQAHGKEAIMLLGKRSTTDNLEVVSTGSLSLDIALGVGGLPLGRVCEIFGPESSGKTTVALQCIAQSHKRSPDTHCAIIDTENALDASYAKKLGVDLERLHISQPTSAEQALEILDTLVCSGGFEVVVLDSVAALVPQAELDGEMGDAHMGLNARLMSQALRKLTHSINKYKTCVIFINQLRQKIGITFGNPETTTGGNALKFYASVRLDVRRIGSIKDNGKQIGNEVKITVVKNKVSTPFQIANICLIFGVGVDRLGEIIDLGTTAGLFEKAGSWYAYQGSKIGQGRENAKKWLSEHPAKIDDFAKTIVNKMKSMNMFEPNLQIASEEDTEEAKSE